MFETKETKKDVARKPDFSAREGIVVWQNQDKNGKPYLTVKIALLNISVNAFSTEKTEGDLI